MSHGLQKKDIAAPNLSGTIDGWRIISLGVTMKRKRQQGINHLDALNGLVNVGFLEYCDNPDYLQFIGGEK